MRTMIPAGDLLRRRCFVWSLSARTWLHGRRAAPWIGAPALSSCSQLLLTDWVWDHQFGLDSVTREKGAAGGKDTCTGRPINGLCVWCGHPTVVTAQIYLVLTWMDGAGHLVPSQPNPRLFWAQARARGRTVIPWNMLSSSGKAERGAAVGSMYTSEAHEKGTTLFLSFFFGFSPSAKFAILLKIL